MSLFEHMESDFDFFWVVSEIDAKAAKRLLLQQRKGEYRMFRI